MQQHSAGEAASEIRRSQFEILSGFAFSSRAPLVVTAVMDWSWIDCGCAVLACSDFGFDPLGLLDPVNSGGFVNPQWLQYSEVIGPAVAATVPWP
jgi:hypothetical protein